MLPAIPLLVLSYVLIVVFWTLYSNVKMAYWAVWAGLNFVGFALGFSGYDIPYSWAFVLSLQSALLLFILFPKKPLQPPGIRDLVTQ